jgi:hypothetical protein
MVAPRVAFSPELLPNEGTLRERLATWVTHRKNPYFAKAAVNRVWAILNGQPLVSPIDNLQTDGFIPPALQILADDFAEHNYDLQRLIRIIARLQVYQLDSQCEHDSGETLARTLGIFPLTRLRPEQMAGSILQASSVTTSDLDSYILLRLMRFGQQNEFLKRYGDSGDDEFDNRGGTIPQRLTLMNGKLVEEKIKESPLNANTRIKWLAADDAQAVESAYLACLSRRPTTEELQYFENLLKDPTITRGQALQNLFWALINSTEFSWNH